MTGKKEKDTSKKPGENINKTDPAYINRQDFLF